jgi:hypothetical protein
LAAFGRDGALVSEAVLPKLLFSKIFLVDMDNGVDFNEFLNVFLVV